MNSTLGHRLSQAWYFIQARLLGNIVPNPVIRLWMSSGALTSGLDHQSPRVRCGTINLSHSGLLLGVGLLAVSFALPAAAATDDGDIVTTALPKVVPDEFNGDLSKLPLAPMGPGQPPERPYRRLLLPPAPPKAGVAVPEKEARASVMIKAAMPSPAHNFEGIARTDACTGGTCGDGTPPDPNGEVGPDHYIQAVNSAYGIYDKTGTRLAAFTENQLWSGNGTICNGQSQGDPVVIYDALADRWILTHFAFGVSGADTVAPYFQCIAVSKTSDPVAGGWWLYPVRVDDATHPWLNDYAKFGIWTDCLYMSANEFTGAGLFQGTLFASFSRADMYAGLALTSSIGYIVNATDPFTMIPSHLGGQSGAAVPAGTPNYFVSESQTDFAFEVRKFTAGPNCGAGGTFSAATNVSQAPYTVPDISVPQPGTANLLDSLGDRLMQKVQYRKVGGQETLWVSHTFQTSASGVTGIQWAQINVTGSTIATTPLQQQSYHPADGVYRWMPSLAVDVQGNMAVGYSRSNGTAPNFPSIAYSGRLASDPLNTLPQTETLLIAGSGSQTGNCGGAACDRWGDYTAMSADPADDCTFWVTNEYYSSPANGANTPPLWQTRIGSFKFPSCTSSNRTADLAITKTDGATTVVPGASITYTIVVTNNGPFAVTGATVTDTVPAAITSVTWTCAASGGNSCPASGSGSISTSAVNLLKGGTATFTIHGTVSPSASGTLANTATVAIPAGFTDPVPGNNTATDIDTVMASVSPPTIGKVFGTSPIVVGQTSSLTITITNPNAGTALTGVAFSDSLPTGVTVPNASGSGCGGTVTVSTNVISLVGGTLAAGGNCAIPVTVTGAQAQVAQWANTINSVTSTEAGANSTPATANITVHNASTTTAIVSDLPDPTVPGQPFTVAYSVSVTAPGAGIPTGAVTVSDGTSSCNGTLPATSCQLASTSAGAKSLTATYSGSANFSSSVSATAPHQVKQAATTTVITADAPDPSVVGTAVAVGASVSITAPGAGTPAGSIGVTDGVDGCTITLPATSCNWTPSTLGTRMLIATYSGDANFSGSVSVAEAHVVVVNPNNTLTVTRSGSGSGTVSSNDSIIVCGATCSHDYPNGTMVTLNAAADAGSVFTGWLGACTGTGTCSLTINSSTVVSATFALTPLGNRILDIDNNGAYDALTDGLMVIRYLLGLTGTSVTAGAVVAGAPRSDPDAIMTYLVDVSPMLDIDGNGQADAYTDGLLIIRYLFGLRGTALTQGAIGTGPTRTTPADIETYLQGLSP